MEEEYLKYKVDLVEPLIERDTEREVEEDCCPKCNVLMDELIILSQSEYKTYQNYCANCGQRLKW